MNPYKPEKAKYLRMLAEQKIKEGGKVRVIRGCYSKIYDKGKLQYLEPNRFHGKQWDSIVYDEMYEE